MNEVIVELVQMHLKPRHLLNFMCTNRDIYMALLFNSFYWTRVAAHLVWRDYVIENHAPDIDLSPYACEERARRNRDAGIEIESLYFMSNTTRPYHECMEIFEKLIRHAIRLNNVDDMFMHRRLYFTLNPDAPLSTLVRALVYTHIVNGVYLGPDSDGLCMRDIARTEVQAAKSTSRSITDVLNELEDATHVSPKLKLKIALLLQSIIY